MLRHDTGELQLTRTTSEIAFPPYLDGSANKRAPIRPTPYSPIHLGIASEPPPEPRHTFLSTARVDFGRPRAAAAAALRSAGVEKAHRLEYTHSVSQLMHPSAELFE